MTAVETTIKDSVIERLGALNEQDLREVYARAGVLLGGAAPQDGAGPASTVSATPDEEMLRDALECVLRSQGRTDSLPPVGVLKGSRRLGKRFVVAAASCGKVANSFHPKRRAERMAAFQIIVRCALKQQRMCKMAFLLEDLADASDVVENAFPGYRAAGLLPFVLRRKRK